MSRRFARGRTRPLRRTRREFLGELLVGGALVSGYSGCRSAPARAVRTNGETDVAKSVRAGSPTKQGMLGVALLGLGDYATRQLAPALAQAQHCALRGIVTGSPQKVPRWQREHAIADANVYDYASLPRIADNHTIDVVYVVVPTSLHVKYAVMAAEAGKHVWCEKPMAMTVEECRTIIDACRRNGVSLSIGYRLHHEPNTQKVMGYARSKPYGALTALSCEVGDYSDGDTGWRLRKSMGGGALYDLGVYSINAIRYASGEEPVRVARARQWSERQELFREVDEISGFELELPSGVTAQGKASRGDSMNRLRVSAERGWYELSPMQSYDGVRGRTSDGQEIGPGIDDQQTRQMDAEARAILAGKSPIVSGEEGLRDIRIVQAIQKAAASGASVDI